MNHLAAELIKKDNLIRDRPDRSAPLARKRGGSPRYPHRKPDVAPVRTVTHTIVLHPLPPRPT